MKPGLQSVQLFLSVLALLQKISTAQNECVNDDVRLTVRSTPSQGIVEVCVRNTWNNVCGVGWGSAEAAVVCRQLGYLEGSTSGILPVFVPGNFIDNVDCVGNETKLLECSHTEEIGCTLYAGSGCRFDGPELAVLFTNDQTLQNNSIVDPGSVPIYCVTNRYPCCNVQDGSWHNPDMSQLSTVPNSVNYQRYFFQGTQMIRSLQVASSGVFYCQITDKEDQIQYLYVGIYQSGTGVPAIENITYDRPSQSVICTSTGGPATSVSWSRDNTSLVVDGTIYQQSQVVKDTSTATYENRLRIAHESAEFESYGVYTCTVSNLRGTNSSQVQVPVCEDGEANITASTGVVNALCYNGVWHYVVLRSEAATEEIESFTAETESFTDQSVAVVVLGTSLGVSLVVVFSVVCAMCIWCCKRKKGSYNMSPATNNNMQMVGNNAYDRTVKHHHTLETSLSSNVAYSTVQERSKPHGRDVAVRIAETTDNNYDQIEPEYEGIDSRQVMVINEYSKLARPEAIVATPSHLQGSPRRPVMK